MTVSSNSSSSSSSGGRGSIPAAALALAISPQQMLPAHQQQLTAAGTLEKTATALDVSGRGNLSQSVTICHNLLPLQHRWLQRLQLETFPFSAQPAATSWGLLSFAAAVNKARQWLITASHHWPYL
jgi:hypothetical protein